MPNEEWRRIAAQQRRCFNELVEVFDAEQPGEVMVRLKRIITAASLSPGEKVLDVGSGVGVLIPLLASCEPSRILAADLAENMLRRLKKKYPAASAIQCDIVRAPVRSGSLDAIIMNAMFGNIADKAAACREAARMLRAGGRLVVSHPEGRDFVDELRRAVDYFIEPFPDRDGFAALLEPAGLEMIEYIDEPKLFVMAARK